MITLRYGLLLVGFSLLSPLAGFASDQWETDLTKARREAQRLNRPILLHFGAVWCAPCQQMERTVLNKPDVLEKINAAVVPVKIDVDENKTLVKRFGVERFPTDIIIEPTGERLLQTTGLHTDAEYIGIVNRAGSRYADLIASRNAKPSVKPKAPLASSGEDTPIPENLMFTETVLALDGYCPVTLWKNRRWEKGSQQFIVNHEGVIVHLASADAKEDFQQNPERYLPKFLGCDPVIVWETDRAVPGKTRFAAFYDEELFLFSTAENRKTFKESPDKYLRTRVVLHLDQLETVVR